MMMCLTKWLSATLAIALMATTVSAADTVTAGKIKSIDAENKTFVLTDSKDKDHTFHLSNNLVVNRGGVESKSNLKAGDPINVCYDKGLLTWTARYILVQEGKSKDCELVDGNVKSYDAKSKELTFSREDNKTETYPMGTATVRLNMAPTKIEDVKIGDHALIIVEMVGGKATLQSVMVQRAK